ncbi:Na+/H+ antiporter NhaA [Paraferrimonas haliotis]|uniref:Na(+)/H(+) antiporter NhaA n=1 Tax=Paraferrimonas haliotis TaxID=2013866 RepID=A0AA37TSN5_9GAMM|nr:Na+/H+ antiporter NhaA [Paraferrimonas haliotis]GLS83701.1 Na(+)/H(+) antiporter NhaA [Paraferrimonas haliotis]
MQKIVSFFKHDAAGGIILVFSAALAMVLANSPLSELYQSFLNIPVKVQIADFEIAKPLLLWINDGLMAIFFFLVGLEIKRELREGHLSSVDQVMLPAVAAIAGIAVPALVYAWFNAGDSVAINGWAIPSATDIAFAVGIFVLFGKSLPTSLKLFLLSVAIFDDIGAIVIIALFYSQDLSALSLVIAVAGLFIVSTLNRLRVNSQAAYILVGVVVWAAVLKSGVHATLAGFALAWFVPLNVRNAAGERMLEHLEHALTPWVTFLVLPVFAFANAGVRLMDATAESFLNPITIGIACGLFIGKQVGIFGCCFLVVKAGLARLPAQATWLQLYGVSLLCGIGFTMSLFIGSLAFAEQGLDYLVSVKIGVVAGSLVSAIAGAWVLSRCKPQ